MAWHAKTLCINGKVVHPRGGGILLDAKRVEAPVKEVEHKRNGLTGVALERLEALRPREIGIPKRQNIKF